MTDSPYTGYAPLPYEAGAAVQHDRSAVEILVRQAQRFMRDEAPLMALAAGLIPNVHRAFDAETVEEGMGELAHRLLVSRKLSTTFVVCPADLTADVASDFLEVVGPAGAYLVVAARSFSSGFREAVASMSSMRVTLLTFAGTERFHAYALYEES